MFMSYVVQYISFILCIGQTIRLMEKGFFIRRDDPERCKEE